MVEIASGNLKARISRWMLDPFSESSGTFLQRWKRKFGRTFLDGKVIIKSAILVGFCR